MAEPKDKRTKEYKDWKALQEIEVIHTEEKGLGDIVETITKKTGIKKVVEKITKDCGCDKRKDSLNKFSKEVLVMFTTRRKPVRCFTDEQFEQYTSFMQTRSLNIWKDNDIKMLVDTYAHVFAIQYQTKNICRNCNGSGKLLFRITGELDKVYNTYK